jgi:predicted metalloprotease with PDZ domain
MRFQLRTLLIAVAILPPILAPVGVWGWRKYVAWQHLQSIRARETGYLGAQLDDESVSGLLVTQVHAGMPAEAGGLKKGDIITSVNKRPCQDVDDFDKSISGFHLGSNLPMVVSRDGQSKSLVVTLGERPSPRRLLSELETRLGEPPTLVPATGGPPTGDMTVQPSPDAILRP